ncbi:sulfotransferase family protein [Novosphingobium lindaniclasticum]|uniref:sulfotransferase family protein n=1 Tax=Novosphingobium lindaniclasticum TaxID=1329895 RepID=UPI002E159310
MPRKAIIVLGMHRSGTSALARTLNLLGCDLPHTLMPSAPANPTGHWESTAIMALNDEILHSAGSRWDDWLEVNPSWYESPVAKKFVQHGVAALREEYGESPLFVFKDPRNCRLVPYWFDVFSQSHIAPLTVIALRNPLEVVASLELRDQQPRDYAILLWLRHVLDAEHYTRGKVRAVLSYDNLLNNWAGEAERLQTLLGVTWPRFSPLSSLDVEAFLDRTNRHHHQSSQDVFSNPLLSDWVHDATKILTMWANLGENQQDYIVLDNIRCQLNTAGPIFGRLTYSTIHQEQINRELRALITVKDEDLGRLNRNISALQQEYENKLDLADKNIFKAQREVAISQNELALTRSALADREKEISQVKVRLQAEQERADLANEARFVAEADVGTLRERLATSQSEVVALSKILKERETELADIQLRSPSEDPVEIQNEISYLANRLREKEVAEDLHLQQIEWLRKVIATIIGCPRWWAFVPKLLSNRWRDERLIRSKLFDSQSYTARYPDVALSKADPLRHYIVHGMAENRIIENLNQ